MLKHVRYDDIRLKKYRLIESISYQSHIIPPGGIAVVRLFGMLGAEGLITLYPGFSSDGATGAPDTKRVLTPAFFHDFICDLVDEGILPVECRREGDDMFRDMLILHGFTEDEADVYHWFVVNWGELKHGTG